MVLCDHVGAGSSDLSAWSKERYPSLGGHLDGVLEICRELALGPVTLSSEASATHSLTTSSDLVAALSPAKRWSGTLCGAAAGPPPAHA